MKKKRRGKERAEEGDAERELPRGKHGSAALEWDEWEAEGQGQADKQLLPLRANISPPGSGATSIILHPS